MYRMFFACQKEKHCHALVASSYPMLSEPRQTSLGVIQPGKVNPTRLFSPHAFLEHSHAPRVFCMSKRKALPCPYSEYLSNAFRALTNESWCDTTWQREIRHISPLHMPFWSIPMNRVFFACQKGKHCHAPIASTYPIL